MEVIAVLQWIKDRFGFSKSLQNKENAVGEAIICEVFGIISKQLKIPRESLTRTTHLIQDLNIDSLTLLELIVQLEDHFEIELPNKSHIKKLTIENICKKIAHLLQVELSWDSVNM